MFETNSGSIGREQLSRPKSENHIAIFDLDETIYPRNLFSNKPKKTASDYMTSATEIYKQMFSRLCVDLKETRDIKIIPFALTSRPYLALTDRNSPLHVLMNLGVIDSSTAENYYSSAYENSINGKSIKFLCENGAVLLAEHNTLKGKYEDVENGWGIQIDEKYHDFVNGPRKSIEVAIHAMNILTDNYQLEAGTKVALSIQATDDRPLTQSEKEGLAQRISDYLIEHNQSKVLDFVDFDLTLHDFDILPKGFNRDGKSLGFDNIQKLVSHEYGSKDLRYYLSDDMFSAVKKIIRTQNDRVKLFLVHGAENKLKKIAKEKGGIISPYEYALGAFTGLYEAISGEKIVASWVEIAKLEKARMKHPLIVSIGTLANQVIENHIVDEQDLQRIARISSIDLASQAFLKFLKLSDKHIEGMSFIVSVNADDKGEIQKMNEFFGKLASLKGTEPLEIIILKSTKHHKLKDVSTNIFPKGIYEQLTNKDKFTEYTINTRNRKPNFDNFYHPIYLRRPQDLVENIHPDLYLLR